MQYLLKTSSAKKLKNDTSLRIWSAGCASDEETYSLAIVIKELLKAEFKNFSLELYGTDIDKKCLATANAGVYAKNSLKNTEAKYLQSYFVP